MQIKDGIFESYIFIINDKEEDKIKIAIREVANEAKRLEEQQHLEEQWYYLEKECIKLKTEQEKDEKLCIQLESELASLEQAVDPMICDRERRKVAEANLEALRLGLMIFMRKLLALHQQDASYLDSMSESAKNLLKDTQRVTSENINSDETQTNMKTMMFCEGREYKEAV